MKNVCPGQDTRYWTFDNIYEVQCKFCFKNMEFFKTDLKRQCPHCGKDNVNPLNDMACAKWCKYAEECLAQLGLSKKEIKS